MTIAETPYGAKQSYGLGVPAESGARVSSSGELRQVTRRRSTPTAATLRNIFILIFAICAPPESLESQIRGAVPLDRLPQLVMTLGGDYVSDSEVFVRITDIEALPDGDVLVLDAGTENVRRFDRDGRLVQTLGRPGSGPGEFRHPGSLQVVGDRIVVWDITQGRLSVFSVGGDHRATTRPAVLGEGLHSAVYRFGNGGYVAIGFGGISGPDSLSPLPVPVAYASTDTGVLDTIWSFSSGQTNWVTNPPRVSYGGVPGFTEPAGSWDVLGDSILVTVNGIEGVFTWYRVTSRGLDPVRTVDLEMEPRRIGGGEGRRFLSAARTRLLELNERFGSARIGTAEFWSGITNVILNTNGDTWFHFGGRRHLELHRRWFVLGPEGSSLRTLEVPEGVELKNVRGDMLLAVSKTEFDSPVVVVYELR